MANRAALHEAIESVFARCSTAEVIARLDAARIACARMNSVGDYLAHPQLAARDCWREIGSPAGPLRALIPPSRIDGIAPVMGDVPALGQHTDAILEELGVDRDTIRRWHQEGTV